MLHLRPYQQEIVDKAAHAFARGKKRVMISALTGTGKTVIAGDMMHRAHLKGNKSIFIVERKELAKQAARKLEEFGLQVGIMRGEDTFLRATDDCVVASIQTIGARWHSLPTDVRMVLIDEAHLLHKNHIKLMKLWNALPVIGLSATPMTRGLGRYFDHLIRGPSADWLMQNGHLVGAVRCFSPRLEDMKSLLAALRVRAGDYAREDLETTLNRKEIISDLVSEWKKHAEGRPTCVFAVSIPHSKSIAEDFNAAGIKAAHIDGYMNDDERDRIIEDYKAGKITVLSSVAVLAIGFDAPQTSCIVLARPTLSLMLHIQQAGRGLRPFEGKDDLIILDAAGNCVRHGLPQFFDVPDLDDGSRKVTKRKKPDKHIVCSNCGYVLERGQMVCPSCAFKRPIPRNNIHFINGELYEDGVGLPGNSEVGLHIKRKWYQGLKWYYQHEGKKPGWAYYAYQEKFTEKPSNAWRDDRPVEPDDEVKRYGKSFFIKRVKSMKKKNPNYRPTSCRHCGSSNLVTAPGTGVHAGALRCGDCNRHLKWLPKEQM